MTAIYGASPWTRTAVKNLTPDELAAIDEVLPEGMFVTLGCGRRPGNWVIHLMQGDREVAVVRDVHYIPNGVRVAVLGL